MSNVEDLGKKARDFTKNREDSPIVADWYEDGLRVIVVSMVGRNFCTYIGVPLDHPIAGHDYDNIAIDCHGGLTFSDKGDGTYRPEGFYWYGWDYGHAGDYMWYGDDDSPPHFEDKKDWTLEEVKKDAWGAIYDMKKLMTLAEAIYSRAKNEDK